MSDTNGTEANKSSLKPQHNLHQNSFSRPQQMQHVFRISCLLPLSDLRQRAGFTLYQNSEILTVDLKNLRKKLTFSSFFLAEFIPLSSSTSSI